MTFVLQEYDCSFFFEEVQNVIHQYKKMSCWLSWWGKKPKSPFSSECFLTENISTSYINWSQRKLFSIFLCVHLTCSLMYCSLNYWHFSSHPENHWAFSIPDAFSACGFTRMPRKTLSNTKPTPTTHFFSLSLFESASHLLNFRDNSDKGIVFKAPP